MKVVYKPFRSKAEIEAFFNEINNSIYIPVECWYREEDLNYTVASIIKKTN